MVDQLPDSQSPYRTSDALQLTVELEAKKREVEKLHQWKKRSRLGVVGALTIATAFVATFSGVLMLRYVPKMPPPEPAQMLTPVACTAPEPPPPPIVPTLTPITEPAEASALEQLGGDEAVPKIASEVTRALYADPVLARSPRMFLVSRAKMEIIVRQQLQTLLSATADATTLDPTELAWELHPNHEEWTAARDLVVAVLKKHDVSEANATAISEQIDANEYMGVDDIAKRRDALFARAAVGLGCSEGSMTSKALESSDARVVTGCGKSAIYNYSSDPNTGVTAWHREPAP